MSLVTNYLIKGTDSWTITSAPTNIDWPSIAVSGSGQYMVVVGNNPSTTDSSGYIYLSSDFGVTWSNKFTYTQNLVGVAISDNGQYMAAVASGSTTGDIFVSSDFGSSWVNKTAASPNYDYTSIAMSSSGQYMVAGTSSANGDIWVSNNFGSTWVYKDYSFSWTSVAVSSDGKYMAACAGPGDIYLSSNSGVNWAAITSITTDYSWTGISMSSSGQYMAACRGGAGKIYRSTDFGVTWTETNAPADSSWSSISISGSGQYMAACIDSSADDRIYVSLDYGLNWSPQSGTSQPWNSISVSSSGQYIAACANDNSGIYTYQKTMDIGSIFLLENRLGYNTTPLITNYNINNEEWLYRYGTYASWKSISASDDGQYMAACIFKGGIYVSHNFGASWFASNAQSKQWTSISVSKIGQYMAACIDGDDSSSNTDGIYISSDYGVNWVLVYNVDKSWNSIAISSNGKYMICGSFYDNTSQVVVSQDFGASWFISRSTSSLYFLSVSISSDGKYMLVGSKEPNSEGAGTVEQSKDYGISFNTILSYGGFYKSFASVSNSSDGKYIATVRGDVRSIEVSSDYGVNWINPIYDANGTAFSSISVSSSGQYMAVSASDGGGNVPGSIFISNDYGKTWLASSSSGWNAISLSGNAYYAVAVNNNGIYFYNQNGDIGNIFSLENNVPLKTNYIIKGTDSWTITSAPTNIDWPSIAVSGSGQYMVVVGNNPSTTDSSGYIYLSSDFGVTWSNKFTYTQNLVGVAISDNGQYMAAVASGSTTGDIFVSSDFGSSWVNKTAASPNYDYTSIAMSSSGQYMVAGTSSANGDIWVSNNFGSTWVYKDYSFSWTSVAVSSDGKYMAACAGPGDIYLSSNSGVNWAAITSITTDYSWTGISMSSSGQYMAACRGGAGKIYRSTDFGVTWTETNAPADSSWSSISISGSGQYMAACIDSSADDRIYVSLDYGLNWSPQSGTSQPWNSISVSTSGQYIAAGANDNSGIYTYKRTMDIGSIFQLN